MEERPPHDIHAGDIVGWGGLVVERDRRGKLHRIRKHYGVVLEVGLTTSRVLDSRGVKRKANPSRLHRIDRDVYDTLVDLGLVERVENES